MATTGTTQKQGRARVAGASQATDADRNQQVTKSSSGTGRNDSLGRADAVGGGSGSGSSGVGVGDELRQLVRDKAYQQIESQKERAAGTLGAVAGAVRNATQGLRDSGQTGLAGYVTRAADEIDRWTSRLHEQDLDDAVREVREFARRKPAIFLGVAFGAGVLAARFFKSSGAGDSSVNRAPSHSTPSSSRYGMASSVAHATSDLHAGLSPTREVL
jgi:hypothetical protein